jgi:WD40 repeat protein
MHPLQHVRIILFNMNAEISRNTLTVAVDSNNTRMFTGHSDGSIVSCDVNSGQKLSTLLNAAPGPTALITCLQTHSSGYLLSMSKEGVAGLFETRGGRVVHVSGLSFFYLFVTLSKYIY